MDVKCTLGWAEKHDLWNSNFDVSGTIYGVFDLSWNFKKKKKNVCSAQPIMSI